MGRSTWIVIGAIGVVLGCKDAGNQNQPPSSVDTAAAAAPVITPADSIARQERVARQRERPNHQVADGR